MPHPVVIIGGGLAGLAAAAGLGSRGVPAILLESRPRLGGRASSFTDRETGETIDNCQHVSMGCCTNFNHFCQLVGIDSAFRREQTLYFVGPDQQVNTFRATFPPAPLHLALAFARLSYLSWREKRHLARGIRAIARPENASGSQTLLGWLHEQRQPLAVIERFWTVVMVSALSESLDRIALPAARKVIVDGFLAHRHAWEVIIPAQPLDELYGSTVQSWLERHGVQVRLQSGVSRLMFDDRRVTGVGLRNGEEIPAAHVILAVPFHRVRELLPADWVPLPILDQLEPAPISSVHLWFDRPAVPLPHAVFVDRLTQWVFNRTRLQAPQQTTTQRTTTQESTSTDGGEYCQAVISASRSLSGRSQDSIIEEVIGDLTRIWPQVATAKLRHSRVVTEHKAVFSPLPSTEAWRPAQQSPIANLQLAGDWTATGWPATMEGATRSGLLAAENILRHLGTPAPLLQSDLPRSRLTRWLAGME